MSQKNHKPIAVFDSGLGGLTVLAELVRSLPYEDFIYFGDTARIPYGTRSPRIVQRYSLEVAEYLSAMDIKLFVIACNTATAHAEATLAEKLSVPVVGVIEPGVEALLAGSRDEHVGVLGTRATIKSGAYERAIAKRDPARRVFNRACPLFVPLVEEGWIDKKITALTAQEYISELTREGVRSVVLGCTHYPLLKSVIQREFPDLRLIDSSVETARAVVHLLDGQGLRSRNVVDKGRVRILVSDITDQMERLETLFEGLDYKSLEEVTL